jgi:hypothetical protein
MQDKPIPDPGNESDDVPIVVGQGDPVLVAVPAEMVGMLCDGLIGALGNAAEMISEAVAVSARVRPAGWFRASLARLDRVRALLDELGWGEDDPPVRVDVDLREHGAAVREALAVALPTIRADLVEADVVDADRARQGLPPKREATIARVRALREFTAAVKAGLEMLAREESEG